MFVSGSSIIDNHKKVLIGVEILGGFHHPICVASNMIRVCHVFKGYHFLVYFFVLSGLIATLLFMSSKELRKF